MLGSSTGRKMLRGLSVPFDKTSQIECPTCARRGTATWEKNASTLARSALALMELSEGFVEVDVGSKSGPRIECAKCRVAVSEKT